MQVTSDSALGAARDRPGELAIGCFASIGRDRLSDRLLAFARDWPNVDIGVHEMPRSELLAEVRGGSLALAVSPGDEQPELQSMPLWRDETVVILPPNHPLAAQPRLTPAALRGERLLMSRQQHGGDMHRFLSARIAPLTPLTGTLCNMGLPRLMDLVAAGEGIALACASHAPLLDHKSVVARAIDAPGAHFAVRAHWRPAQPDWPLDALIATLKE